MAKATGCCYLIDYSGGLCKEKSTTTETNLLTNSAKRMLTQLLTGLHLSPGFFKVINFQPIALTIKSNLPVSTVMAQPTYDMKVETLFMMIIKLICVLFHFQNK